MNRLGNSENYWSLLELETALAIVTEVTSDLLPLEIIQNPSWPFLFHLDFDNFDEFVNDLAVEGPVHRSHGTMLQLRPYWQKLFSINPLSQGDGGGSRALPSL